MARLKRARVALLCGLLWAASAAPCQAGVLRYCDPPSALTAAQKDQLLRFTALIKRELDRAGQGAALIARSGLDLDRFGQRYSHSGVALQRSDDTPWAVRQLYFACDEKRPRLYDQGLAAFVLGASEAAVSWVSVVLLPATAAAGLEAVALDKRQALQLLGDTYSANAYPYNVRYQNCNQWVAELLATAWAPLDGTADLRARAQGWLQDQGYVPTLFDVGWPLMWLGGLIPWVHDDDHPGADIEHRRYRVSMPAAIEAFVQSTVPGAVHVEFCHRERQVVIHHGWDPMAAGCQAGEQDQVVTLD